MEPADLEYVCVTDTTFYSAEDDRGRYDRIDGITEEYLTDAGILVGDPLRHAVITGWGMDNLADTL
jgi:hypothetical protein